MHKVVDKSIEHLFTLMLELNKRITSTWILCNSFRYRDEIERTAKEENESTKEANQRKNKPKIKKKCSHSSQVQIFSSSNAFQNG